MKLFEERRMESSPHPVLPGFRVKPPPPPPSYVPGFPTVAASWRLDMRSGIRNQSGILAFATLSRTWLLCLVRVGF
jgi:hypothetical protein